MKTKNLKIILGGKKIILNKAYIAEGFMKCKGLMFTKRENARILLFEMKKPLAIHSLFVFFPFVALWLDEKNRVVEWKVVKPFSLREMPSRKFSKIAEIPINRRYYTKVKFAVEERFKKKNYI